MWSTCTRLGLPVNTGITLVAGSQSGLGRESTRSIASPTGPCSTSGPALESNIALDLPTDDSVGIVSLGGRAGTGKSVLALAAALEAVLENRTHSKVIVFRPLYAVGGQDIGYLPGSEAEKMSPWAAASPTRWRRSPGQRSSTRSSIVTCSRSCR